MGGVQNTCTPLDSKVGYANRDFHVLYNDDHTGNRTAYYEPDGVCWNENLEVTDVKRLDVPKTDKELQAQFAQINAAEPDLNADGIKDEFVVQDSKTSLYLKLKRGVCMETIVETCDEPGIYYHPSSEKDAKPITVIYKSQNSEGSPKPIEFTDVSFNQSRSNAQLTITGYRLLSDSAKKFTWTLTQKECPPPPRYYSPGLGCDE